MILPLIIIMEHYLGSQNKGNIFLEYCSRMLIKYIDLFVPPLLHLLNLGLSPWTSSSFFKKFYLFIFRERRREGERHQCVVAFRMCPPPGTWPPTQACALTRNRTSDT